MSPADTHRLKLAAQVEADLRAALDLAGTLARLHSQPDFAAAVDTHAAIAYRGSQFYSACESALVRLLTAIDQDVLDAGAWHARVLADAALEVPGLRPAWIGADTQALLDDLRRFRHFLRHAYAVALDPRRLASRCADVAAVAPLVERDLRAALAWLRA